MCVSISTLSSYVLDRVPEAPPFCTWGKCRVRARNAFSCKYYPHCYAVRTHNWIDSSCIIAFVLRRSIRGMTRARRNNAAAKSLCQIYTETFHPASQSGQERIEDTHSGSESRDCRFENTTERERERERERENHHSTCTRASLSSSLKARSSRVNTSGY